MGRGKRGVTGRGGVRLEMCSAGLLLGLLVSVPAVAFELPAGVPARNEGLWQIDRAGTISDGTTTIKIQKIWNACLDAEADRALHKLEILEEQASVATLNERCEDPVYSLSANVLSSTMRCAGPSPIDDRIGKTIIRRSTVFVSDTEVRTDAFTTNDNLPQSHGHFLTRMKRLGVCPSDLKPGNKLLRHWLANGEETLKARQVQNIYHEIEERKMFIRSRLER